jgi:hypothetical protein
VQGVGSLPGVQRRASAAKVCTSEARKMRVPLARARSGAPQEGLVSLPLARQRGRGRFSGRCGVSPLRRVSEDGSFIAGWSREEYLLPKYFVFCECFRLLRLID